MKRLIFLGLLGYGLFIYVFQIEPNRLIIKHEEISLSVNTENEISVAIFSDTHYRTEFFDVKTHVEQINSINADIVLFVGDLIDDYKNDPINVDEVIEEYKKIDAPYGKYAIMGNHDYGGYADKVYKEIMEETGFELLINESKLIEELNINIIGMDDSMFGEKFKDIESHYIKDVTNILLTHEGDVVTDIREYYDFAISGHSHGGQIDIPFLKKFVLPPGAEEFVRGYYEDEKIYTTSGIGTTQIHARFMVVPEIVSLTLKY